MPLEPTVTFDVPQLSVELLSKPIVRTRVPTAQPGLSASARILTRQASSSEAILAVPKRGDHMFGDAQSSVESTSPSQLRWLLPCLERFAELLSLELDWDHHGALPIAPRHLHAALTFLTDVMRPTTPSPHLVPIANGGVQVEWHRAGLDVEIAFSDDDELDLYCYEIASGRDWEGPAAEGFAELDLAERLSGPTQYPVDDAAQRRPGRSPD